MVGHFVLRARVFLSSFADRFAETAPCGGSRELGTYPGTMPGRTPRRSLTVLAPILALLASCSGTTGDTTTSTTSSTSDAIEVVANEYNFVPAVLTLDGVSTVMLRNEGGLAHTWTVLTDPIESEGEIAAAPVLAEGRVEVGQTALIDLVDVPPGRYQVVCAIPGHFSAGMEGEVVIGDG